MPKLSEEKKTKIGELVGEATMQWNPIPTGEFKSQEAVKILNKIYEVIEEEE